MKVACTVWSRGKDEDKFRSYLLLYPFGLKGREIPIEARITNVADSYDALRSKRCYKESLTHKEALDILKKSSGIFYDPDVVIMLELFEYKFK